MGPKKGHLATIKIVGYLEQARDFHLGLLDGQLLRGLQGQEQFAFSLRRGFTRCEVLT